MHHRSFISIQCKHIFWLILILYTMKSLHNSKTNLHDIIKTISTLVHNESSGILVIIGP